MSVAKQKRDARKRRQARVRKTIKGTTEQPRLCVYRSLSCTYAQLISDENGAVIVSATSKDTIADGASAKSTESAKALGVKIAELAKEKEITKVVFDRNGYLYHGRIAAVAEGAREGGLKV